MVSCKQGLRTLAGARAHTYGARPAALPSPRYLTCQMSFLCRKESKRLDFGRVLIWNVLNWHRGSEMPSKKIEMANLGLMGTYASQENGGKMPTFQ